MEMHPQRASRQGTLVRARDRQTHHSGLTMYCLGGECIEGSGTCLYVPLGRMKQGDGEFEASLE